MNTNPNAKTVVCYGDSNTWGANPFVDERIPADVRWVGVLQNMLGNDYEVINEGLCGRTFIAEDPQKPFRSGISVLKSILETNQPIDVIAIMLGTNDLKDTYKLSAEDIASHLLKTIKFIKKETTEYPPKILVICPPPVANPLNEVLDVRMINAPKESLLLHPLFEKITKEEGCAYLHAGAFISLENTDGYHLGAEHHKILGEKVAEIVKAKL